MKATVLALILSTSVVSADSTNVMVRVAGRLQSTSEIEQLVIAQARRAQMQFDFGGVRSHFTVQSNSPTVISMWCGQTNGSFFYATVDRKGSVDAQELTLRDADTIRTLVAGLTTNTITQVWLGPDGRVGAMTARSTKEEFEVFWLKRVRSKWTIHDRGVWKVLPPLPPVIPAREIDAS